MEPWTDVNLEWNDVPDFDPGNPDTPDFDADGEDRKERNDYNIEKEAMDFVDELQVKHNFRSETQRLLLAHLLLILSKASQQMAVQPQHRSARQRSSTGEAQPRRGVLSPGEYDRHAGQLASEAQLPGVGVLVRRAQPRRATGQYDICGHSRPASSPACT
ncbi:hypothetical protein Bca52824_029623 [Brassica carinata]|uniref:Uncharacterized protein n=1 Tax=Brassica carinata TaxID=52824 RepID=A0A8X7VEA2_BRACI|nr:hypothetical protein Bca52824_029623 [Brassica carinata]